MNSKSTRQINPILSESGTPVYVGVSVGKPPLFNRQSKANICNKGLEILQLMLQLMLTSIKVSIKII